MRPESSEHRPRWLARLGQQSRPARVVNLCFIAVFFLSTLVTWRQVIVLESAYISSQHNSLENVTRAFETRLQLSMDDLIFFRTSMVEALKTPLPFEVLYDAQTDFQRKRSAAEWVISLQTLRTLPVKGISDAFVQESRLLSRDNPMLESELTATLELGYLLCLARNISRFTMRTQYVSRAGFFITTDDMDRPETRDITASYYQRISKPWFSANAPESNPRRTIIWGREETPEKTLTASVPLDYDRLWLGVLSMDFDITSISAFLNDAAAGEGDGSFHLYDSHMNAIARSGETPFTLDEREEAQLAGAIARKPQGGIRMNNGYISWERMKDLDGVMLRVHTLNEGVRSDFGTLSIALTLLWILFTSMLLISWVIIRRMVHNMSQLHRSLEWQAWHDTLTRLYNRGALFERASKQSMLSEQLQQPMSVIQLDLDHFKRINDTWGHQAGDRVLAHVAGLISSSLRKGDIAGRVGGEEFCLLLPNATLEEAKQAAERIRQRINSKEILLAKGATLKVSASLGVSCSDEQRQYDFEQLQSTADGRLYRAKQQGRNRVETQD